MYVLVVPWDEIPVRTTSIYARVDLVRTFARQNCLLDCSEWTEKFKAKARSPFTLSSLAASAANGCRWCALWKTLFDGADHFIPEFSIDTATFLWINRNFSLQVRASTGQSVLIQFFSPPGNRFLPGDTQSNSSFQHASDWIHKCETSHPACGSGRHVPLPTRLLALTPAAEPNGHPTVQLSITTGLQGVYACLSHCWGDPKHMKTKTEAGTIRDYLNAVPWDQLPRIFQDAVTFTLRLGLRFLWIDSLCIIQSSTSDWQLESSRMAEYYHNSFVTLVAVASTDSRGGCFRQTMPDGCLRLHADDGSFSNLLVGVRRCELGTLTPDASMLKEHYPLFERAWALQERKLSRRILYFDVKEVRFACQETTHCECNHHGFLWPHLLLRHSSMAADIRGSRNRPGDTDNKELRKAKLFREWAETVEIYIRLALSREADILPALSGCAHDLAETMTVIQGTAPGYLAGLWLTSLLPGLLWHVVPDFTGPPTQTARLVPARAPSWSWASVQPRKGIEYIGGAMNADSQEKSAYPPVEVIDAAVVLAGSDPTGQVASGHIRLRAVLAALHMRYVCFDCMKSGRTKRLVIHTAGHSSAKNYCHFPARYGLATPSDNITFYPDFSLRLGYLVDSDLSRLIKPDRNGCLLAPVFLLHIEHGWRKGRKERIQAVFLALKETGPGNKTYERVGLVKADFSSEAEREDWFCHALCPVLRGVEEITLV